MASSSQVESQGEVSRLLARGIVFSILWVAGAGSFYSIYLARRAHRMIQASGGQLRGMRRVWWCYVVGGFGVLLITSVLAAVVINSRQ